MKRIIIAILLSTVLLGWMAVTQASAQDELPPWVNETNCPKDLQEYEGLAFCISKDGDQVKAYVIVIDLKSEGIRFEYITARGWNPKTKQYEACYDVNVPSASTGDGCREKNDEYKYPIMSLLNAVGYAGSPAIVIDTDYGAKTDSQGHGPEGFAVVSNTRIDGPAMGDYDDPESQNPDTNNAVRRPWLALSHSAPFTALISQIPKGEDDGGKYRDWIYTGIGGGPWLIQDGKVVGPWMTYDGIEIKNVEHLCSITNKGSCYNNAKQTSVGLSQNGRFLYIALVFAETANLDFTTEFMSTSLEVWNALKWDGGGSSHLWYEGWSESDNKADKIVVVTSRWLSQYLAIYAEEGDGIEFKPTPFPIPSPFPVPTPTPPPGDGGGLFDWFTIWWQNSWLNQRIQDILDLINSGTSAIDAFTQFLENIKNPDWWTQQLLDWTAECLGSLVIPASLAVLGWGFSRRRRR